MVGTAGYSIKIAGPGPSGSRQLRQVPLNVGCFHGTGPPIPARLQAEQTLGQIKRTPQELPNEPKMALRGGLYQGQCAAQLTEGALWNISSRWVVAMAGSQVHSGSSSFKQKRRL